jgi:hypothetical protein
MRRRGLLVVVVSVAGLGIVVAMRVFAAVVAVDSEPFLGFGRLASPK